MKTSVNGFTLIELVVVITIIAILAAVALPRYINIQTQARIAKLNAVAGSIRAAAALAKAQCLVDNASLTGAVSACPVGGAAGTVTMEGSVVAMFNHAPRATVGGILLAANINAAADGLTIVAGNPISIQVNGATTLATCQVTYTEATAVGSAPAIAINSAGC